MDIVKMINTPAEAASRGSMPFVPFDTCFQQLANQMMNCPDGQSPPCILLFQGGGRGSGVSTISRLFAHYLSEKVLMRVLLIDADFDNPTLHKIHRMPPSPGFADYLEGTRGPDIAQSIGNLSVMAAGDKSLLPRTLLSGRSDFKARLRELGKEYEMIILDAAPITTCPETFSLASCTDGVIFVAKSEKTRKAVVHATMNQLHLARAKVVGGVLNFRRFHIPTWLYH
ncbi:CpsD/CapB family tyrosine-protein kinase [Fundidesulfovibrio soli]|uniref:CpsD/CapB family tyrosine-protein kinase n=1 Tax=Fundidesulfovibrio soli TaxID=2922716 RepID=UPI001FAEDA4F|nr:CpsD/CapB family tyrosine-protein kinase [Fundidesulfovibrio soli]